jgi:hypothetical protein
MLTTAQQIEKRGIRKGIQQGRNEGLEAGKLEIAKTMLKDKEGNISK